MTKLDINNYVNPDNIGIETGTTADGKKKGTSLKKYLGKIIEVGTNEYGTYKKYDNGVLECWNTVYIDNITCTKGYYGIYYGNIDTTKNIPFPHSFIEAPTIVFSPPTDSGIMYFQEQIRPTGRTKDKLPGLIAYSYYKIDTNPQYIWLSYHAIGKWR